MSIIEKVIQEHRDRLQNVVNDIINLHNRPNSYLTQKDDIIAGLKEYVVLKASLDTYVQEFAPNFKPADGQEPAAGQDQQNTEQPAAQQ